MKSQKIIGILIFISIISIMFILGYYHSSNEQKNKRKVNGIKWSFNSNNSDININLSNEKIAPGSSGDFLIELDITKAETNIFYEIKVNEEINIPKNLKLFAEIMDESNIVLLKTNEYNSLSELAQNDLRGIIEFNKNNSKRYIKIYWNWIFDNENDEEFINPINYGENQNLLECYYNIEIIGKQI